MRLWSCNTKREVSWPERPFFQFVILNERKASSTAPKPEEATRRRPASAVDRHDGRTTCSPGRSHDYSVDGHPVFGRAAVSEEPNCRYRPNSICTVRSADISGPVCLPTSNLVSFITLIEVG